MCVTGPCLFESRRDLPEPVPQDRQGDEDQERKPEDVDGDQQQNIEKSVADLFCLPQQGVPEV